MEHWNRRSIERILPSRFSITRHCVVASRRD